MISDLIIPILTLSFSSIIAPMTGFYFTVRKKIVVPIGMAHILFGGIGIGLLISFDPFLIAFVFALVFSVLMWNKKIGEDVFASILFPFSMALGLIGYHFSSSQFSISSYLFGSILFVTLNDILYLSIISVITIYIWIKNYKGIFLFSFHEDIAKTRGINTQKISLTMLLLSSIVISILIKIVGVLLVNAIILIPPAMAIYFSKSFKSLLINSVIIGFTGSFLGLLSSLILNLPIGATITFVLGIMFLFLSIISKMMKT